MGCTIVVAGSLSVVVVGFVVVVVGLVGMVAVVVVGFGIGTAVFDFVGKVVVVGFVGMVAVVVVGFGIGTAVFDFVVVAATGCPLQSFCSGLAGFRFWGRTDSKTDQKKTSGLTLF